MLFCKIFRFVTTHFQKYENQNSSINNFYWSFWLPNTFTEDRNILVIKPEGVRLSGLSYMGLSTIDKAVPEPILYRKRADLGKS
jgi:hypothetical protein